MIEHHGVIDMGAEDVVRDSGNVGPVQDVS
jgi:hypothetical protein